MTEGAAPGDRLAVGQRVGGYVVTGKLGEGAMGQVFAARHALIDRRAALKVLHPGGHLDEGRVARLLNEARALGRLRHPGIVEVFDCGRLPDGTAYLVMEHLEGRGLGEQLASGVTPLQAALLGRQVALALAAAHDEGIVHRDLKPDNILLVPEADLPGGLRARVVDFGLAKLSRRAAAAPQIETRSDLILGTAPYMAPEQCLGARDVDDRTDVYALGVILYELLAGRRPFVGEDVVEIMDMHLRAPLPPLRGLAPRVDEALAALVEDMLEKDPARRPAMAAVAARLALLVEMETALASAPAMDEAPSPRAPRGPYRGLTPFTAADAPYFHGREGLVERLLAVLSRAGQGGRFLAVLGPSGSGKSSVVQAGLLPALRRGLLPGSEGWLIVAARPAAGCWHELEEQGLPGAPADLAAAAGRSLKERPGCGRVVLCIDPFEEALLEPADPMRDALVAGLAALLAADLPVSVVLAMRDDFYGRFARHAAPLLPWLERGLVNVPPTLSAAELAAIIEAPARAAGLRLADGLSQRLLADVLQRDQAGEEAAGPCTVLPLLEFALGELWERRAGRTLTHAAYDRIGGVSGGVAGWAEREHRALRADGLGSLARRVLTDLVHLGDEEQGLPDSRRRRPAAALHRGGEERGAVQEVLRRLTAARLLVAGRDGGGEETVELIHDALLREWGELRRWLDEDRRFLRWHRELERRALDWERGGRGDELLPGGGELAVAEGWLRQRAVDLREGERALISRAARRRARRRGRALAGLGAGLGLSLLLGGLAVREWRRAEALLEVQHGTLAASLAQQPGKETAALLSAVRAAGPALRGGRVPQVAALEGLGAALGAARALLLAGGGAEALPAFSPDGALLVTTDGDDAARVWDGRGGAPLAALRGHGAAVCAAAFSPDGRRVLTGSQDGTARLWAAASGAPLAVLRGHEGRVCAVAFFPDGARAVTAGQDGTARLWDLATGAALAVLGGHAGPVLASLLSPDGALLATADRGGAVRLWDARSGQARAVLLGPPARRALLAFSPDGRRLLSTNSAERTGRLWDLTGGAPPATVPDTGSDLLSVAFSPDGRQVATGGTDHAVRLWDAGSGRLTALLEGHGMGVIAVSFAAGGERLLSLDPESLRLWDLARRAPLATLHRYDGKLSAAAISPDGRLVAAAPAAGPVQVVDLGPGGPFPLLRGHRGMVTTARFSRDGAQILTSGPEEGVARLWDARTGAPLRALSAQDGTFGIYDAALSPDGALIATGGRRGSVRLWDARTGAPLRALSGHGGLVYAVSFSPDGRRLATAAADGRALVWDAGAGALLHTLAGHEGGVRGVSFSPDGGRLVTAGEDGTARLWDAGSGRPLRVLRGHGAMVYGARFSPGGDRLVTAGSDGTARLWEVGGGGPLGVLRGHGAEVNAAAFSPDGRRVVTGSDDGTARVWDAASGAMLAVLPGGSGFVLDVAFSPDGAHVVTGNQDATAAIYPATAGELLASACDRLRAQPGLAEVRPLCRPLR